VALVVFLRGLNVGGHRALRPTMIRRPVSRVKLRTQIARRLPFDAQVVICEGRDIRKLASRDCFDGVRVRPDVVRFVSVLSRLPRSGPRLPMTLPAGGPWLLKVLAREGRFVLGLYRRRMKVIGYLGRLDRLFGAPVTTRSWSTIRAIADALDGRAT
jgi:hypothetical protein